MVETGMSPADAIRSATVNSAELLGIADRAGAIRAGNWADVIAVSGNPLADISRLREVAFVMKAGRVYKRAAQHSDM